MEEQINERLDLSYLNIQIVQIDSDEFIKFYSEISSNNRILKLMMSDFDDLRSQDLGHIIYLAIPIDKAKPIPSDIFSEILNPILIICPSQFGLIKIMTYKYSDEKKQELQSYLHYSISHISKFPEPTSLDQIGLLNNFIRLYFERYKTYLII